MSAPKPIQTHFVTTFSPAHFGDQNFIHQDVHTHLATPYGDLIGKPIAQDNHRPLPGLPTIPDFILQKKDGLL